jgi:hypothetical protein
LREGRELLSAGDREFVDSMLESTGADAMFEAL